MLYYSHMEERYNLVEQILVWGHGKYTRESLNEMTLDTIREIYNKLYLEIISRLR